MFSIFNKKRPQVDLSALVADMHSHLVPGIDDGSPDVDTSDLLIKGLMELGFKKLITTPHIMADMYPNSAASISSSFEKLKSQSSISRVQFPLKYAAEYFLDEHFDELLRNKEDLLCISGKMVLTEFSFITTPMNYKEKIFNLQIHGYQPILAHPERYFYLNGNRAIFDELKTAGCLFAVNLLSFCGYYGKLALDLANHLLKMNYIDFLGTDLHHIKHLEALQNANAAVPIINELLDRGKLLNPSL